MNLDARGELAEILRVLGYDNSIFRDRPREDDVIGVPQPASITRVDRIVQAACIEVALRDGEMHSSTKNLTPLFPRVARPDAQLVGGFCHKGTPPRRLPWEYQDSPPPGRRRSRQMTDVRRSRSR